MRYSIGQAAQMLGVSVRTLRHYDRIGLVKPALVGDNGYRYYDREELALLQQVLFYYNHFHHVSYELFQHIQSLSKHR